MAGFGGSIKLTGESEYRNAIKNITNDLKTMSKALKEQSVEFSASNKAMGSANSERKKLTDTIKTQQAAITKAKASLAEYSVVLQGQQAKHNKLSSEYRKAVSELENIRKTSGETSEEYKNQAQVVDKLGTELAESTAEMNESKAAMSQLKSEINNSQKIIDSAEKSLDELGNEAEDSGEKAKKGGEGFTIFKGIVADLGAIAITAAISGLKQLGSAVINVGKQAYGSYAQYEQLVGGVETLFGDSSDELIKYAQNAYKTSGISANQYMEQATSFSATLLQGLGGDTKAAAKYADMAIRDMSDNANKMGTDIGMIQNAYQGFAKGNYSMLDNLKLGYGGTQAEMARLINDSGVLGDSMKVTAQTVKDVPFDKQIEAIHKVQENMGILGTTSLEAADTIEGSTLAMKASWENLLVGLADEKQDLSPLIDNFVEQVIAVGKNAAPRVKQILEGMGELIKALWDEVLPKLADEVPQLEPFINALQVVHKLTPLIITGFGLLAGTIAAIKFVSFIQSIQTMVGVVKSWNIISKIQTAQIYAMIAAEKIQAATSKIVAGAQAALNAVMSANPIALVIIAIVALVAAFVILWKKSEKFREFWINLWEKIKTTAEPIIKAIKEWFIETWDKIKDVWKKAVEYFKAIWDGIKNVFSVAKDVLGGYFSNAWKAIKVIWDAVTGYFKMVWNNIKLVFSVVKSVLSGDFSGAWNAIKKIWNNVKSYFSGIWNGIKSIFSGVGSWFSGKFSGAVSSIKNAFKSIPSYFSGIWSKITNKVKEVVNKLKNAFKFKWKLPDLKLPHISVSGGKAPFGIGGKGSLPKFHIDWRAMGGVFDKGARVLTGIGEDGAEAIVPLENNTKWIKKVAADMASNFDMSRLSNIETIQETETMDYNTMVRAFKDALSQMKVEMDDYEMGKFIDKTVTRLVYN